MKQSLKLGEGAGGRARPPPLGPSTADLARAAFELQGRRVQELEAHLQRQRGLEISLASKLGDGGGKVSCHCIALFDWRSKGVELHPFI